MEIRRAVAYTGADFITLSQMNLNHFLILFFTALLFIRPYSGKTQVINIGEDNLIANSDFMSQDPGKRPLRWIMGDELQTAWISAKQHHDPRKDDKSLQLSDSSIISFVLVRSEKVIANPGTIYRAKAWVKGESGTLAMFYIECWDQNAKRIGIKSIKPEYTDLWQEISIELKAPDKITHLSVSIASSKEGTGASYWDDISLIPEITYNHGLPADTRELFIDNYRLESLVDVERVVHPAKKSKPLINPTETWEGNSVYIYGTVLKDKPAGSGYRMWYTSYIDKQYFLCYATSTDGITWVKPNLGIIEFNGSKENNICKIGGGTLVYDALTPDYACRYKLMTFEKGEKFGYGVYFSSDGLHWVPYSGNPVISYGDVSNVAYDEARGIFIASTKQRMLVSNTSVTPGKQDRAAFISTSRDFIHWTAPGESGSDWTIAVEGDYADDLKVRARNGIEGQIYGMTVHPYAGQYIGLPWVFDINTYNTGIFAVTGDGSIRPQITISRDLRHWSRTNRDPVIPLGKAGAWDDGTLYTASTMQVSVTEISIYYGAMNLPHGGNNGAQTQIARIAKASWRRDGFVSLSNAGDDTGIITTKPVIFTGKELRVNAVLNVSGSLKVEVLDSSGQPVAGYTLAEATAITGDQLAATVNWKKGKGLEKLTGKKIKLRFYLDGGDLYSYWFAN